MTDLDSLLDEHIPASPTLSDLDKVIDALEYRIGSSDLHEVTKSGDLGLALQRACQISSRVRNGMSVGPELQQLLLYLQTFKLRLNKVGVTVPETIADCLTEMTKSLDGQVEHQRFEVLNQILRGLQIILTFADMKFSTTKLQWKPPPHLTHLKRRQWLSSMELHRKQ